MKKPTKKKTSQRKKAIPAKFVPVDERVPRGVRTLDEALIVVGYEELARVLKLAYAQAAVGKGRERHATPQKTFLPFHKQPIVTLPALYGPGAQAFQISKNLQEACTQGGEHGKNEVLGAIVYCAAMYLTLAEADDG